MTVNFSEKQRAFIAKPFDYTLDVNEGTPRSSKTTAGVFRYARYLLLTRDRDHLILGYNKELAYRLFIEADGLGLKHIFKGFCVERNDGKEGEFLEIDTPNGKRRVFYRGAGKKSDVGGFTGLSFGSVAFMEINLLHADVIQEAFRRTFAAKDRYHYADLNPPSPNHKVIKDVFEVQNMDWWHWTPNDNPILTEQRKKELYETLSRNSYLLKRDWYGERTVPTGVIYGNFSDTNKLETLQRSRFLIYEMWFEADGGQSDATTCSCNIAAYDRKNERFALIRYANYYHSGAETGETLAMSTYAQNIKKFIAECEDLLQLKRSRVGVDSACKSLREELHKIGIQTERSDNNATDKPSGKELGIERLQNLLSSNQFYIVIENGLKEYDHIAFMREIESYVRKDNGEPIDDFNHALDECRYSTNYFYKRYMK